MFGPKVEVFKFRSHLESSSQKPIGLGNPPINQGGQIISYLSQLCLGNMVLQFRSEQVGSTPVKNSFGVELRSTQNQGLHPNLGCNSIFLASRYHFLPPLSAWGCSGQNTLKRGTLAKNGHFWPFFDQLSIGKPF